MLEQGDVLRAHHRPVLLFIFLETREAVTLEFIAEIAKLNRDPGERVELLPLWAHPDGDLYSVDGILRPRADFVLDQDYIDGKVVITLEGWKDANEEEDLV